MKESFHEQIELESDNQQYVLRQNIFLLQRGFNVAAAKNKLATVLFFGVQKGSLHLQLELTDFVVDGDSICPK